jgi:hypothetical protein
MPEDIASFINTHLRLDGYLNFAQRFLTSRLQLTQPPPGRSHFNLTPASKCQLNVEPDPKRAEARFRSSLHLLHFTTPELRNNFQNLFAFLILSVILSDFSEDSRPPESDLRTRPLNPYKDTLSPLDRD